MSARACRSIKRKKEMESGKATLSFQRLFELRWDYKLSVFETICIQRLTVCSPILVQKVSEKKVWLSPAQFLSFHTATRPRGHSRQVYLSICRDILTEDFRWCSSIPRTEGG